MLEQELLKYKMDIVALQEIRWRDAKVVPLSNYTLFNSGSNSNVLGTGFIVKNSLKQAVLDYEAVSERICRIRLKGRFCNISMVSVHAPTEEKTEEEKDELYGALERTVDNIPGYDVKMVLGDWNAKVGKETDFLPIIGKHSRHDITSENGFRMIDFATSRGLRVSSTFFAHKNIHKETWTSPDGMTRNQIDHVLVESRHTTDIQDVRAFRGANCDSDHFLVKVRYKMKIASYPRSMGVRRIAYNVEKLKDEETRNEFNRKVEEKSNGMEVSESVQENWSNLERALKGAAEEVLGLRRQRKRNDWFDQECEEIVKERNDARMKLMQRRTRATTEDYKRKRAKVKRICRKKRRIKERERLEKIQEDFELKSGRKFYTGVRNSKVGYVPKPCFYKDEDGNLLGNSQEVANRWVRYFEDLLNVEEAEESDREEKNQSEEVGDEDVPPDQEEIMEIIASLKNNKAPGIDDIPAEFLKYGGQVVASKVYKLIWDIWTQEIMPEDWSKAVLCPIYKKGDKMMCENYRGIALLPVAYKVLSIAINRRLTE